MCTDFTPSSYQIPYLPRSPQALKIGNLAKVILQSGRIVVGRIHYVGLLNDTDSNDKENDVFVGLQLPTGWGDTDGMYNNKRLFSW